MKKILLAGSTGYLGVYIAKELQQRACFFRAIARSPKKLGQHDINADEILEAELTDPDSIAECCNGIDAVISTVGITKQKDGLLYCSPKWIFLGYGRIFNMAKRGRVYLFGKGAHRANPIHGEDLAVVCVDAIARSDKEIEIGGPETLTQHVMASIAFDILGHKPKITHIPDWVRVPVLKLARWLTGSKVYGPIEFFMTVMAMDMLAPEYGTHTLKEYFTLLNDPNA